MDPLPSHWERANHPPIPTLHTRLSAFHRAPCCLTTTTIFPPSTSKRIDNPDEHSAFGLVPSPVSLCLEHLMRNLHSLLYITLITGTHKFRLQFQFVQYLLHSPLVIEVWGKQSGRKMSRRETQGMAVRNAISPLQRTSEESVVITNDVAMVRSCCFLYISHGSSASCATLLDFKQASIV